MECPICFEEFENKKKIVTVDCCKQKIHLLCLMKCVDLNQSCPFCRVVYIKEPEPSQEQKLINCCFSTAFKIYFIVFLFLGFIIYFSLFK